MKERLALGPVSRITLALWLVAVPFFGSGFRSCGEEATSGGRSAYVETIPSGDSGRFAAISLGRGNTKPDISPSSAPQPRRVLVRDIEQGTGPVARQGDRVALYYFSVKYKTGNTSYYRWPPEPPLVIRISDVPWEKALIGMRPGGLREAIIPSHLHLKTGTIDYLYKMVRVGGRTR